MSKILSQEEIDALLTSAVAIGTPAKAGAGAGGTSRGSSIVHYNFRRPDRVSKDQIRSLHLLHDRFARNVGTSLSAYLRAATDVSVASVEQFTYAEFLMSVPDPTAFYAVGAQPLDGLCALELNPNVAFTMIDRMLGGTGRGLTLTRALTEIEQNVIDAVVRLICENLTETWRQIVDVQFRVHARETRPQMLQVVAPNEVVVLLGFDLRMGDARGMLNFCVPASVIEAIGPSFTQNWHRTRRARTPADRVNLRRNLAKVRLKVAASLETKIPARDLLQVQPGDVITLGHQVRRPLDIRVQAQTKFTGRLIVHHGRTGVRVENSTGAVGQEA